MIKGKLKTTGNFTVMDYVLKVSGLVVCIFPPFSPIMLTYLVKYLSARNDRTKCLAIHRSHFWPDIVR